ncbi:ferredoxin--NADP reductase [Shewanella waksmanii]|uniref:ferredoxin--NADP reductase n=1 Tax=Shewanella waksmanii TaxID=213783 RepID=UPI00048E673E|nr:ferredoxin--NADP reductase [Shewanella waksmanii]
MWITATVVEKIVWNDNLFSLKLDAEVAPFIAGQFIKLSQQIDGKRVARAYSLVNSPESEFLEVLAIAVEDGQLSPQLQSLVVGDQIDISPKATGFMTLEELPAISTESCLWLLATGTAVGPFLSMLRTAAIWQTYPHIALVYSVRQQQDLAYLADIEALKQQYGEQFSFVASVTREKVDGALTERISDAITSGALEQAVGHQLTSRDAQVMMCGNPQMITDVTEILKARGLEKNLRRKPGQITVEKYW